jgi:crotonobetainyl-CoA:carnitine CoA-transferase CaiB-like acyl-CoA transferase
MDSLETRAAQIDRIYGLLAETFLTRTTAEWIDLLNKLHIPAAPLRTPAELFNDPHLDAVGFFETVDSDQGPVRFPGVPTWFSRTPGAVAGPTQTLGADTDDVLRELGLADEQRG